MAIIRRDRPISDAASIPRVAEPGSQDAIARGADTLRRIAPAVGRLSLEIGLSPDRAGSAFLVGERLVILARYSAQAFIRGVGDSGLELDSSAGPAIDFASSDKDGPVLPIVQARFVHPYFDLALVALAEHPAVAPLELEAVRPLQLSERDVCIIGFPQEDPRSDPDDVARVARSPLGGKKVQPGMIRGLTHYEHHGLPRVSIAHDCSTLGGNSGSPLIDLASGRVLGVHFAGQAAVQNFAVPAWELGRDIRLRNAGIRFSEPLCPWAHLWNERVAKEEAIPGSYVRQEGNRFVFYINGREQGHVIYPNDKRQALVQLLLEVFEPAARIRDFVSALPGAEMFEHEIHWEQSGKAVVVQAIRQLEAQGLLDRRFFERLSERAQLRSIVARWIETLWSADEGASIALPGQSVSDASEDMQSENVARAEASAEQCDCHRWPASFDPVRQRIVPVRNLRSALERTSALARVHLNEPMPSGVRGIVMRRNATATGLLIDPNWVLLGDTIPEVEGKRFEVAYVTLENGEEVNVRNDEVVTDSDMGWSLLPLTTRSTQKPAVLRQRPVELGEPVSLAYYLRGQEMHVSFRDTAVVASSEQYLRYVASPSWGTYGCPVFDANWEVVAINSAPRGEDAALHTLRCATGTPIQRIANAIAQRGLRLELTSSEQLADEDKPAVSGGGPSGERLE